MSEKAHVSKDCYCSECSQRRSNAAFLSEVERRAGATVKQMMDCLYDESGDLPPAKRFNLLADWLRHILGDKS